MTEPELTAAQAERVRRLLADARHGAPMPPEVVARLDGVLRDLADERAASAPDQVAASDGTVVVSLDAARRRRRRATGLLVAAVAAAVVGIGVPSFVRGMSGSDDAAGGSSASTADLNDAPPEAGTERSGPDDGGADDGDAGGDTSTRPEAALAGIPSVAASTFRRDAIRLADTTQNYSSRDEERSKSAFDALGCARADAWGVGDAVTVLYADQPALLLFREPTGGLQQVDLFLCDSSEPELTTLIPAP